MIRINSQRDKRMLLTELRMTMSFGAVMVLLMLLGLSVLCFVFCVHGVRVLYEHKEGFRYARVMYLVGGVACFFTAVSILIRAVRFVAAAVSLFGKRYSLSEELLFEDEGYTSRYTAENGVTVEGRYSYAAVKKVITYKDHILIASPDQTSVFRLSDITEGTAEELSAILAGKLGDRVTHK